MSAYGGLLFKKLNRCDLDEVLSIENDVHPSPWSAQKFLTCFNGDLYCLTGLYTDKHLLGYAVLMHNSPDAELHNIAISKAFQNRGLGKLFLNHLIGQCVKKKLEQIFLEVRESNAAAIQLYRKSGFTQIGNRENYYQSKTLTESALIFKLELSHWHNRN